MILRSGNIYSNPFNRVSTSLRSTSVIRANDDLNSLIPSIAYNTLHNILKNQSQLDESKLAKEIGENKFPQLKNHLRLKYSFFLKGDYHGSHLEDDIIMTFINKYFDHLNLIS